MGWCGNSGYGTVIPVDNGKNGIGSTKVDACLQTTAEFLHSPVSTSSAKLDKVLFFNSIQNTPFFRQDKKNFAPDINSNNCGR